VRLPEFLVGDRARLVLEPLQAEPGRHVQRERVDAVAIEDDDVVIGLEITAAMLVFSVAECIAFFERMGAHNGRFPQVVIERTLQGLWDGFAPRHVDPPARPPRRGTRRRSGS